MWRLGETEKTVSIFACDAETVKIMNPNFSLLDAGGQKV